MHFKNLLAVQIMIFVLAIAPVKAQAATLHPSNGRSAAWLYNQAIALLDEGRYYDKAAALLRQAISLQPTNPDYHSALGCAYADRASSLSYAYCFLKMEEELRKEHPSDFAVWPKARIEPVEVFPTKDDMRPLILSDVQIISKLNNLDSDAQGEWKTAVAVSKSPIARARAENTYGWGLCLLERSQKDFMVSGFFKNVTSISEKAIGPNALFVAACNDDPKNPTYWQSLGNDNFQPGGHDFVSTLDYGLREAGGHDPELIKLFDTSAKQMTIAYQRALSIQPRNPGLWYRLSVGSLGAKDKERAEQQLAEAIRYAPNSAFLHYQMASTLLSGTQYDLMQIDMPCDTPEELAVAVSSKSSPADKRCVEDAVGELGIGNKCPSYPPPSYEPAVPQPLKAAWNYWNTTQGLMDMDMSTMRMRGVARSMVLYAYASGHEHDPAAGARALNAATGMGYKIAGKWPEMDSRFESGEVLQTLVGIAIVSISNDGLSNLYKLSGDKVDEDQVAGETQEFKLQVATYKAHVRKNLSELNASTDLLDTY